MLVKKFVVVGNGPLAVNASVLLKKKVKGEGEVSLVTNADQAHPLDWLEDSFLGTPQPVKAYAESHGVNLVRGTPLRLDPESKTVSTNNAKEDFDYALIALSLVPGQPSWQGVFPPLPEGVEGLKHHLNSLLAKLKRLKKSEREPALSISVVGGGPLGVGFAAILNAYLEKLCPEHGLRRIELKLSLFEKSSRLLPEIPEKAGVKVKDFLERNGVCVFTNTPVRAVSKEGLLLSDGSIHPCKTVAWCTGLTVHPFVENTGLKRRDGKLLVNEYLQTSDATIYAAGPCVSSTAFNPTTGLLTVKKQLSIAVHNLASNVLGGDKKSFKPREDPFLLNLGAGKSLLAYKNVALLGATSKLFSKFL